MHQDSQGHRDPIRRIDFAGEYLMSAGAETIRLWDLKTFECISVVKTNSKASITALACDASGAAFVGSVDCRIKNGSHDSTIRVWSADDLSFQKVLRGHRGSVLALTRIKGFLLSGGRDSVVRVWDLETWVCCDILRGHESSVLSISAHEGLGMFASSSADGTVRLWDLQTLSCLKVFEAIPRIIGFDSLYYHAPPCMACVISPPYVIVCSDDGEISLHDACVCDGDDELEIEENGIIRSKTPDIIRRVPSKLETTSAAISARIEREFEKSLRSFIKIQTVSADPGRKQDCFQGAKFLLRLLESIGAEVKLAPTMEGKNPLVMGRIGNDPALKTITFYGHYDVQPAMEPDWSHYPFELHAKDGYYIGRGVSENKGPILAFIFAVREMLEELRYSEEAGKMPVNVAFLFEGEEENGSIGFKEAVQDNIRWFEGTRRFSSQTPCGLAKHIHASPMA
eukprot:jgi/Picre1/29259/NNA_004651.t1